MPQPHLQRGTALSVIVIALQHAHAKPTPIEAVAQHRSLVIDFHRLHEIHLFAFPGVSRIFPNEPFPVGLIRASATIDDRQYSSEKTAKGSALFKGRVE
jgi:hypothetical protein